MKCNQSRPGFELVSPCPFPTTITITRRAPPNNGYPSRPQSDNRRKGLGWPHSENQRKRKLRQILISLQRTKKAMEHEGVGDTNGIPGEPGRVPKSLVRGLEELEIEGRVETNKATALLGSTRILRRVLETRGNLVLPRGYWKSESKYWCKKIRTGLFINNRI